MIASLVCLSCLITLSFGVHVSCAHGRRVGPQRVSRGTSVELVSGLRLPQWCDDSDECRMSGLKVPLELR